MPNIKSIEQARAELPGSVIDARRIEDHKIGSAELGTLAPLIHKGTQIATRLIQKGSRASVTKTGTNLHFSPSFSGTPCIFLAVRAATATIHSAIMANINSAGGTVQLVSAGTKVVDYLAWDPSV